MKMLECDYLVIGSGATGMAFVDEIIHKSQNIKVVLVDKRAKPGGHWVDAYDFVRLHAPAAWYGVNSRPLGSGGADLTSKAQILAYYELVLEELLSTGRLTYLSQCNYLGDGKVKSLLDGNIEYQVKASKKTVDATLLFTQVPATKPPEYSISDRVHLVPVNGLAQIKSPWKKYVIIGGGKTGIDAVVHLLDNNVDPDKISWIIPNDSWFFNRDPFTKTDLKFFTQMFPTIFGAQLEAKDINECYKRWEEVGFMNRLDKNVWPTKMRSATVSSEELKKMQSVRNVIRLGRIERIESDKILFQNGDSIPTDTDSLHVDCTAAGTKFPPLKEKIYDGNQINLQMVLPNQPCTSGAKIASLELMFPDDEDKKNSACTPVPAAHEPVDWFQISHTANINNEKLGKLLGISWMRNNRLSPMSHITLFSFVKVMYQLTQMIDRVQEKNKLFGEQASVYGKFD